MNAKQYIRMAKGSPITGYPDYETGSEAQSERKMSWLRAGKKLCKQLAKELGLADGTYDIRVNPAGPACSGDVHLHSSKVYIALEQTCLGPDFGFMYRECTSRHDFTGKQNRWAKWESLLNLPELAKKIKQECHIS